MKTFGGWHFPDHEQHLIEWLTKVNETVDGRLRYQGKKQDLALSFCKQKRVAVDVGAHIGLWSFYLAQQFEYLHAFEPVAEHRRCFDMNVVGCEVDPGFRLNLHECALGDHEGSIAMHTSQGSSGDSWVNGAGDIPLRTLDSFELQDVDFIKLDCEGGELSALKGAEQTLLRCKPCVIVEQKPGRADKFGLPPTGAVQYLESLGAKLKAKMSGDYVLAWD